MVGEGPFFYRFCHLGERIPRDLPLSATAASGLLTRLPQEDTSLDGVTSSKVTMRALSSIDALSRSQHEGAIFQRYALSITA